MAQDSEKKLTFSKEFTRQEPIPEKGIQRAVALMRSGRLHRYNTTTGEISEEISSTDFSDGISFDDGLSEDPFPTNSAHKGIRRPRVPELPGR